MPVCPLQVKKWTIFAPRKKTSLLLLKTMHRKFCIKYIKERVRLAYYILYRWNRFSSLSSILTESMHFNWKMTFSFELTTQYLLPLKNWAELVNKHCNMGNSNFYAFLCKKYGHMTKHKYRHKLNLGEVRPTCSLLLRTKMLEGTAPLHRLHFSGVSSLDTSCLLGMD